MIKAVIFDYGGVVTDGGRTGLSSQLGSLLGIRDDEAWALLSASFGEFMRGTITENELWDNVGRLYGQPIPTNKRDIWNKWDSMAPFPEMLELIARLKSKGITVGLLSNTIPVTQHEISTHGGYDPFDFTVLSPDVGYAKPDREIYAEAVKRLGDIAPSEAVFIDDQERFLAPAQAIGMHTILALDPRQISDDIDALIAAHDS